MRRPRRVKRKLKPKRKSYTTKPIEGTRRKGPYPPDDSDMRRRIEQNPIAVMAEARHKLHAIQAGYRRDLYEVLAMIVGVGRYLFYDYVAWKAFFSDPFFEKGRHKPKARAQHKNALRHTMNYVFDAKTKQARSRTGKYAAALHEIMISGMPVNLIAGEIEKQGGIEKLYDEYLERKAHHPKKGLYAKRSEERYVDMMNYCNMDKDKVSDPRDIVFGDLEEVAKKSDDVGDEDAIFDMKLEKDTDDLIDIYQDAETDQDRELGRGRDPDGRLTVELEVTKGRQERFLELSKDKRFVIEGRCLGRTPNDWQRLKIYKVTWKGSRR